MSTSTNIFSPAEKQECKEVVRILQNESLLAVDCEGVQLGKDGPLTLLQIATLDGTVYLFDVMETETEQDKNFFMDTGLESVFTSSEIVKVMHSCSGDSAALFHQFGIKMENVFDTQVANLVIEEHKGSKIPLQVKLEEICKIYSTTTMVYEGKADIQCKYNKKEGNFWAKRPLTREMIDYASSDAAALIPEVYENQKRYLEENGLMGKFSERLQEEIEIEIDPVFREKRKSRHIQIKKEILTGMVEKYNTGTDLADLTVDEKRALNETSLKDISSATDSEVMRELKLESLQEFVKSLEEELNEPEKFYPKPFMMFKLNEIAFQGTKQMKKDGTRIKEQFIRVISEDIERKYDADTPLSHLTRAELNTLQNLRPLYDKTSYTETVLSLHWRIIEDELDEEMDRLACDPEYEVQNVQKLIRFIKDYRVPKFIKDKAQKVREINEEAVIERLPHKYDFQSSVDEITEAEKIVLDRLDVIRNSYDPVVEYLHWEVTYLVLCQEFETFKAGKLMGKDYMSKKLNFLSTNDRVPDKTREKAEEFQQEMIRRKEEGKKRRK